MCGSHAMGSRGSIDHQCVRLTQNCAHATVGVQGIPARSMPRNRHFHVSPPPQNCDKDLAPNAALRGWNNRYYTPHANASATCDCCGLRPLAQLPAGLADNFTASGLPTPAQIIAWGRAKLLIPA